MGFASALSAPLLKLNSRRKHRLANKVGRLKAKRCVRHSSDHLSHLAALTHIGIDKFGCALAAVLLCRKFLPPFLVDGFIGAIGEIGQLAVLYPVDTIKVCTNLSYCPTWPSEYGHTCGVIANRVQVRCQAQGSSTRVILEGVRSQGFNSANLSSLFAGCAPSAVCAGLIGACYLASFCGAKRVLARASGGQSSSLKPAQYDAALAMSEPSSSPVLSGNRQAEAERSHQRVKVRRPEDFGSTRP